MCYNGLVILNAAGRQFSDYYGNVCSKNKPAFFGFALAVFPFFVYAGLILALMIPTGQSPYDDYHYSGSGLFFAPSLVFWALIISAWVMLTSMFAAFVLSLAGLVKAFKGTPLRAVALLGTGISALVLFLFFMAAVVL